MCQGEWEVGWIGGDRDGICMRGEDAAGLELWMGAGAHSSGLALSARGVSLSLEQAALGFCQLEQVPEISHASPALSALCHPSFPARETAPCFPFPPLGITFCSEAHLACDKHGHSLRTSKSSAIWQLQDREDSGERMLGRDSFPKSCWQHHVHPSWPGQSTRNRAGYFTNFCLRTASGVIS